MPSLAERQRDFAATVLRPEAAIPVGLSVPAGASPTERFAVYRNNIAVSLIEALRSAFPVVNQLVGQEFFSAMARTYALACPPSSPVLLAYGAGFPDFIAGFAPAANLPYLHDVARLEWLWLEAYHAPDAEPLTIEALSGVAPFRLPQLQLTLHPAARSCLFRHPARTIWCLHQDGAEPVSIELRDAPEQALIVRPQSHVEVVGVSPGTIAFLSAIADGATIGDAAEHALNQEPVLDIGRMLPLLFQSGAFAAFHDPGAVSPQQQDDRA